jgi:hypothetical protein
MNKILLYFFAIVFFGTLAFSVASCSKIEREDSAEIIELTFDIKIINASAPETKTVKTNWENGDRVYVFFKKNNSSYLTANKYVTFTYDSSSMSWNVSKDGCGSALSSISTSTLGTGGTMYAVYFPFGDVTPVKDARWSSIDTYRFFYSSGNINPALDNYPAFSYYLIDTGSAYTVSGSTVTGTLSMALPENFVYFYIEADGGKYNENEKYRLCVEGVKPATVLQWGNGSFTELELAKGLPMWGYKYGNGIAFAGIIDESWASATDHQFIFFSDGDPAVTKTFHDISLTSHQSVKLKAPTASNGWERYMMAPDYVEIAGNKWSKWFLGSTNEDDVTNLHKFRWAEIVPDKAKDDFDQLPIHDLTDDDYTAGTASYAIFDPARAILGADWRMPNRDDFNSLVSNCTLTSNTSWFTFTSGDKSIKFPSSISTTVYLWTSQKKDNTYVYTREYHSGENKFTEASSGTGDSPKRQFGENFVRPIYIGE